jgi:hypothetical protein
MVERLSLFNVVCVRDTFINGERVLSFSPLNEKVKKDKTEKYNSVINTLIEKGEYECMMRVQMRPDQLQYLVVGW